MLLQAQTNLLKYSIELRTAVEQRWANAAPPAAHDPAIFALSIAAKGACEAQCTPEFKYNCLAAFSIPPEAAITATPAKKATGRRKRRCRKHAGSKEDGDKEDDDEHKAHEENENNNENENEEENETVKK